MTLSAHPNEVLFLLPQDLIGGDALPVMSIVHPGKDLHLARPVRLITDQSLDDSAMNLDCWKVELSCYENGDR